MNVAQTILLDKNIEFLNVNTTNLGSTKTSKNRFINLLEDTSPLHLIKSNTKKNIPETEKVITVVGGKSSISGRGRAPFKEK